MSTDVPLKYLQYFLDDDDELARVEAAYAAGLLSCGEVKQRAAEAVSEILTRHQQARARVTAEDVKRFTAVRPLKT